jgi:hypothetical protein
MRKKSIPEVHDDDLRSEYGPDFFKNLKPNRFAGVTFAPPIYLDKDVAEVFDSFRGGEFCPPLRHQGDAHGGTKPLDGIGEEVRSSLCRGFSRW